ncbi:hypothetical protein [Pasteuria penetrans]|uniref:hypothetical protein n=1 Tax=Pasteuria penetrans TaxID=86005 RepID=UPI000FBF26D6|nr:hypothetical protein [Pasteuria penetrans]
MGLAPAPCPNTGPSAAKEAPYDRYNENEHEQATATPSEGVAPKSTAAHRLYTYSSNDLCCAEESDRVARLAVTVGGFSDPYVLVVITPLATAAEGI